MPTATVNGRSLHYTRRGEGPPLLMVMGLGGHGAHWGEEFPALLAERLDVIALDNVGTGRSDRLDGELTIAGMAADAVALLDELGLGRAHLLGLSMGGMIAQRIALDHADRVERLVLVSTSPSARRGVRADPAVFEALGAAWTSGDRERAVQAGFEFNVSAAHAADPGAQAAWAKIAGDRPVSLPVLGAQLGAIRDHDELDRLADLDVPTLLLAGTEDQILPYGNAKLLVDAIPGARLETFESAGHLLYLEQPERAARLVLEFLLD